MLKNITLLLFLTFISINTVFSEENNNTVNYVDYDIGERIGMSTLNIFFGVGSIINGHKIGLVTTAVESFGFVLILLGPTIWPSVDDYDRFGEYRAFSFNNRRLFITAGTIVVGVGALFGLIVPFFHHKPNNISIAQKDFSFDLELVSSKNQEANGLRVSYRIRF